MLELKHISRYYVQGDNTTKALDDVNLSFRDSEFVSVLGPSGSGKTTLLNVIGGLDHYTSGDLLINGVSTKNFFGKDWDAYRNNEVGFIFQGYNLIGHQTVLSNVELALTLSGIKSKERKSRAMQALTDVGLANHANKYPQQLSGGQMQRVAIARALVNNPSIIFADEPTGALDTNTSIEIMDLLKEMAKDKLVVMVTHNPELAREYSTRIVELKDGHIIGDSNPYTITETPKAKPQQKTAMSPLTALRLSFSNFLGKKGRTLLTSFAGSIGIVGIALILALSNGVNSLINDSNVTSPDALKITISSTRNNVETDSSAYQESSSYKDKKIDVNAKITKDLSLSGANDLGSLVSYFATNPEGLSESISSCETTYNTEPLIYSVDNKQLYPDNFLQTINFSSNSNSGSTGSSVTSNYFQALPQYTDTITDKAEVVEGRWPKASNECVLVLDKYYRINDSLMYLLGLRDSKELTDAADAYKNNEKVNLPSSYDQIDFNSIMNMSFRVVQPSAMYEKNNNGGWTNKVSDSDFVKSKVSEGSEMKIVGIINPKDSGLNEGVYFPQSVIIDTINYATNTEIVQSQLANPEVDVLTGKTFEEEKKGTDVVETKKPVVTPKISAPKFTVEDITKIISQSLNEDAIKKLTQRIETCKTLNADTQDLVAKATKAFVESGETDPEKYFKKHKEYIDDILKADAEDLTPEMVDEITKYATSVSMQVYTNMSLEIAEQIAAISSLADISINLSDDNISKLANGITGSRSYDRNLHDFGYCDWNKPSSITIYAKDVEGKQNVKTIINNYNKTNEESEHSEKVISYTDFSENLAKGLSTITGGISGALIAFVAISLIVSSIMIGIITYVSVLERRKEIGILRAIGARRKDIFLVFNAETFIIGLTAGVMGMLMALLISVPGNAIIKIAAHMDQDVMILSPISAIVLIAISVLLTFIAGYIPSRKASRKDPVEAINS